MQETAAHVGQRERTPHAVAGPLQVQQRVHVVRVETGGNEPQRQVIVALQKPAIERDGRSAGSITSMPN